MEESVIKFSTVSVVMVLVYFQSIVNNIHHALPALSNVQRSSVFATYLPVPEPLEPRDFKAKGLFPYRSFVGQ